METTANLNSGNAKTVTVKAKWALVNYEKAFDYTGSAQTFTAPYSGYYKVELWGAQSSNYMLGAYVSGKTKINKSSNLYLYVGGRGSYSTVGGATIAGGWNGGGNAVGYPDGNTWSGGGSTDIRTVSNGTWNNSESLRSRIMVAAGAGGGTGDGLMGTAGGTLSAEDYIGYNVNAVAGLTVKLYGASQTSPGIYDVTGGEVTAGGFGFGGSGGRGGAGSGWYGGNSWKHHTDGAAASTGGSSYISGHTGSVAVTSTTNSAPKSGCTTGTTNNACSISPFGYTFSLTQMIAGNESMPNTAGTGNETGHSGNGYAKITWLGDTI